MPYALRDMHGEIIAVSKEPIDLPGWEYVEGSSRAYIEYLDTALKEQDEFRESDIQLARVLEDLISLLIERDVIHFTDFPAAAQKRLIERQALRRKGQGLDIIDDGQPVI